MNFQLFDANDFEHRLKPKNYLKLSPFPKRSWVWVNLEIGVEYQSGTINKYGLHFIGKDFQFVPKHPACLASDACGIPSEKHKMKLSELKVATESKCTLSGGCC